ncbi:MAG TPA: efflux RND transporter periplasmic adaptor subunit [Planctomycetaceae bacterium]|nr:efflux RND transporter periplasmic adaptor subunit [Planctomycetaceae bacterium]
MNRLAMTIGLMSLSIGGGLAGCGQRSSSHSEAGASGQPPVRVTAIAPQRKTLVRTVELPGRVEAYEVAPLHAKATGYVVKVPVDIGDKVQGPQGDQPGTLLCELQVPELNEELAQKAALMAQAQAEVLQTDAGVKVAEAGVRSANAKVLEAQAAIAREESQYARWQSEFQRVSQLVESGALTKKVADETRAQLDGADAGRKEVAARIAAVEAHQQEAAAAVEKAKADAVAVRSQLAVAEAEQRRLAAMVEYTSIRAPFDGVVVERNVHTGHLVQAGAGSNRPLLTVMRIDPVRVVVDIPEIDAVRVSSETKVELKVPSMPGAPYSGTVTRTSWSLNTTSRTLTAEIHVPNADGPWRPGQYVQVKLTVAELENCLSLPKSAIVTQDKQTYCFGVGADGKVVRLPVALGLQAGSDVEVREGLTGNEQIISVNANAFREGQIVEIAPPPQ